MTTKLKLFILFLMQVVLVHAQLEETSFSIRGGLSDSRLKTTIESNISSLLCACNAAVMEGGKPDLPKNSLTKDAREILEDLWKTSPMVCPLSRVEETCLHTADKGYQIRNIPVSMMNAEESEKQQELVINLTPDGLIDNIMIAIEEHRYKEIMDEHESVEDLFRRQVIVDFVENYRTSYNRKDIKYIESVFSDNALIITGKVVREKPRSDQALLSLGKDKIVYQKQNKQQYIKNLKNVFSRNKYLNIIFEEIEVIQHPKYTDIYGVTLKQEWNADKYRDVGYVFLMIDFQDELHPLIQVRTWQPEKVGEHALARDEVFDLGDFDIVRSLIND